MSNAVAQDSDHDRVHAIGGAELSREEVDRLVLQEQLNVAYESLGRTFQAVFVALAIVSAVTWSPARSHEISIWVVTTSVVAIARLLVWQRFRRLSVEQRLQRARLYWGLYIAGAALGGAAWGLLAILLWDPGNLLLDALIILTVAGMCAGSVVTLAAVGEASLVFIAGAMGLLSVPVLLQGGGEAYAMAGLCVVFLVMVGGYARRASRTLVEGIEMKLLRTKAEERVRHQALYDALTGLPNRRLLRERIELAVSRVKRGECNAAILFMDLDRFKRINDTQGHGIGDGLLIELGKRIRSLLRREDTAARIGGDEFVALLSDLEFSGDQLLEVAQHRADEFRKAIEQPVTVEGIELRISASIGVAIIDTPDVKVDDMLKHADTAMYQAKDDGRNTVRFFASEMEDAISERMRLESALHDAIENDRGLSLALQPQYNDEMEIRGVELLLRWQHEGVDVAPATFIPIAEESGLIYRLGDWVIEEAGAIAEQLANHFSHQDFSVAINVSTRQFQSNEFAEKVLSTITRRGLPQGFIELEVTESLLIEDVAGTIDTIGQLRAHGVRFSIDDFGTGYSSLSYLKSLPLDMLKIDQSFVRDVLDDAGDASIVRAIISVADSLDIEVIAEGVESEPIHDYLVRAGCRRFQGYFYARPMILEDFLATLDNPGGQALSTQSTR